MTSAALPEAVETIVARFERTSRAERESLAAVEVREDGSIFTVDQPSPWWSARSAAWEAIDGHGELRTMTRVALSRLELAIGIDSCESLDELDPIDHDAMDVAEAAVLAEIAAAHFGPEQHARLMAPWRSALG